MENLYAVLMLHLLMRNLNCWACELQKVYLVLRLYLSIFYLSLLIKCWSPVWPMSSLLLLKASPLCLREPPVFGKMHKGMLLLTISAEFLRAHQVIFFGKPYKICINLLFTSYEHKCLFHSL